jgi:hypothetical protein
MQSTNNKLAPLMEMNVAAREKRLFESLGHGISNAPLEFFAQGLWPEISRPGISLDRNSQFATAILHHSPGTTPPRNKCHVIREMDQMVSFLMILKLFSTMEYSLSFSGYKHCCFTRHARSSITTTPPHLVETVPRHSGNGVQTTIAQSVVRASGKFLMFLLPFSTTNHRDICFIFQATTTTAQLTSIPLPSERSIVSLKATGTLVWI